jgi:hypothetical protein
MELVDITPEDSVVPVYLEVLNDEEQAVRDAELAQAQADQEAREAERIAKEEANANGMAKLIALGLTEEEAGALING